MFDLGLFHFAACLRQVVSLFDGFSSHAASLSSSCNMCAFVRVFKCMLVCMYACACAVCFTALLGFTIFIFVVPLRILVAVSSALSAAVSMCVRIFGLIY